MLLQRSIVVVLTLLFHEYVVAGTGTATTAEEGDNYEALDTKKSTPNDPQLNQMYVLRGMVENSQDTIADSDNDDKEVDAAPSEIVETHVSPDDEQPEPNDETPIQTKRPRRRRRRRRRKRPKPVQPNPDELESYYTLPEEEIKRKPIKYHSDGPATAVAATEELSTVDASNAAPPPPPPRRRNVKRRRRPIKRPPIDADYPVTGEGDNSETNQTDAQVDQTSEDADEALVSPPNDEPIQDAKPVQEIIRTTPIKSKDISYKTSTTEVAAVDAKSRPKDTNQVKIFTSIDARRYENEATSEQAGSTLRRRKRPSFKVETTPPDNVETTTKPEPSSTATSDAFKSHLTYVTSRNEVKIDEENQPKPHKHFDRSKYNETKKENFKLRPLPPISAILRNAKLRTKNETHVKIAKAVEIPPRIKETVSNEIQTHVVYNDEQKETRNDAKVEENRPEDATPSESSTRGRDIYELPVITYTEQRQKPTTTTSTVKSISESATSTDNTAYIYIPCNHTTNDAVQIGGNRIQPSNDTTISSTSDDNNLETIANVSTVSTFDTVAIRELEKLLQSEIDSFDSRNASERPPPAQSRDTSALESQLDYLFQHKSGSREPKEIPEFSSKLKHDSKDNRASKTSTIRVLNEDIFLTYTSTAAALPPAGFYNELDPRDYQLSSHLRNASTHYRKIAPENVLHKTKNQAERKKLPLAVKSAIIISGAILALAVLGFFALLLSCKIRQAKSRMKCHRELYREQFQNSEFRQSSRSTSPVVSKTNYNGRTFSNNIQSNVASNRNYYLWQTLRKTFQYD